MVLKSSMFGERACIWGVSYPKAFHNLLHITVQQRDLQHLLVFFTMSQCYFTFGNQAINYVCKNMCDECVWDY